MKSDFELQYIFQITTSLLRFSWAQRNRVANFRCPYCGDSKKSTHKSRAYLYLKQGAFFFDCKNCGHSTTFNRFIKDHFPMLHKEYRLAVFKENLAHDQFDQSFASVPKINKLPQPKAVELVPISDLSSTHPAVVYLNSRQLPLKWHSYLGFVSNFSDFVTKTCGINRYERLPKDKRIIIPMKDERGNLFAFQGRSLDPKSTLRYITIKFDENSPKMFGRDRVDVTEPVIVTEGPFDSMFMPNSIAICGGDVSSTLSFLNPANTFIVLDNEPRSKDTIARMERAIQSGYRVCFWRIDEKYKDINQMILEGKYTQMQLLEHVVHNSFSGAKAKLKMTTWKKV